VDVTKAAIYQMSDITLYDPIYVPINEKKDGAGVGFECFRLPGVVLASLNWRSSYCYSENKRQKTPRRESISLRIKAGRRILISG